MEKAPLRSRPAIHVFAGRIARFFGLQFYDLYFGEKDLLSPTEPVAPLLSTEVRPATPEDLNRIIHRMGGETRREFEQNISLDSTCYVAFYAGAITGYLWVNREIISLTGMYVAPLPPRGSFMHNVFVFPEHRRKGIFQQLFHAACNEMRGAGFLSIACFVDKANSQSVDAFRNEGVEFNNAAVLKLPRVRPFLYCRALA